MQQQKTNLYVSWRGRIGVVEVLLVGQMSVFRKCRWRAAILCGKWSERVSDFLQGFQVVTRPVCCFSNCVAHAHFDSWAHTGRPIVFNETDRAKEPNRSAWFFSFYSLCSTHTQCLCSVISTIFHQLLVMNQTHDTRQVEYFINTTTLLTDLQ